MNFGKILYCAVLIIALVVAVFIYAKNKNDNVHDKHTNGMITLIVTIIIGLAPVVMTLFSSEATIQVFAPEVEGKIRENDDLKKEVNNLEETIANLEQEKKELKDKNDKLNEKNFAEIIQSKLVVDGLELDGSKKSMAIVDGENYFHEDIFNELVEKNIQYDDEKDKIFVGNKEINEVTKVTLEKVSNVLYDGNGLNEYNTDSTGTFFVGGNEYSKGFVLEISDYKKDGTYGLFNLDGKFSKIEFCVGKEDSSYRIDDAKMKVFLDGEIIAEETISAQIPYMHFEFDVKDAKSLKIALFDSESEFGFYDVMLTK
ncbi:cell division protein FtsB [Enterococcus sp. PF1-24]|uniref:hypothetical protein n=1 Tax=unclassified Enterococcus TaxID=2608891 RepID=UPI0024733615|nr:MULTISPECIES: hypothetical protein [unclassified Enterococcus]MDH6365646.1 cell division protein FtsB [Enterococcus sp. PFB1-1]MDH6402747.1 cell division protein FtsB [Enterococcus sp. PF1-24]